MLTVKTRLVEGLTNVFNLLLGILAATVATPFLLLALLLSFFCSTEEWLEFWSEFADE